MSGENLGGDEHLAYAAAEIPSTEAVLAARYVRRRVRDHAEEILAALGLEAT